MLGEAATTEITRNKDAQGFVENKDAAQRGGKIAGDARKKLEIESGRQIVSKENYLPEPRWPPKFPQSWPLQNPPP